MIDPQVLLADILAAGRRISASDIHLRAGLEPTFRVDGELHTLGGEPLEAAELAGMLALVLPPAARRRLRQRGAASASAEFSRHGRVRLHAYRTLGETVLAIRLLALEIPQAHELGLPPQFLERLCSARGLVLFAGATGSGKTTAMAAALAYISERCAYHILSIEDPVEYRVPALRARVTQREIGRDVRSFDGGIYDALRSDPDVVAIGELRDAAAISAALRAAETGHLVLATVHGADAAGAVDRIIDAFDAAASPIRAHLAGVLEAVLGVALVPKPGGGRRMTTELLVGTSAVKNLIREGRTHQLPNAIATGRAVGMHRFETAAV